MRCIEGIWHLPSGGPGREQITTALSINWPPMRPSCRSYCVRIWESEQRYADLPHWIEISRRSTFLLCLICRPCRQPFEAGFWIRLRNCEWCLQTSFAGRCSAGMVGGGNDLDRRELHSASCPAIGFVWIGGKSAMAPLGLPTRSQDLPAESDCGRTGSSKRATCFESFELPGYPGIQRFDAGRLRSKTRGEG